MRRRFRYRGGAVRTLDQVPPGGRARIIRLVGGMRIHRRLADMGMVRDTLVVVVRVAPLGDPMQIKIRGYDLSLRKSEARRIEVEELG